MRRGLLSSCAALLLCAAPAGAVRPLTPPAPEFPAGRVWLNAKPLTMRLLRGKKAVLVAFINTGNLNSLRTLKVVEAWWDRYALEGLMVVGVQSPEYEFQKDPRILKAALKNLGVRFPVVMDVERSLWKAYGVEGWPAMFLVNHKGRIVFDALGEGNIAEFEGEIRAAAEAAGYEPSRSLKPLEDAVLEDCGAASETAFVGSGRGKPKQVEDAMRYRGTTFIANREGEVVYQGDWAVEPEGLVLAKDNKSRSSLATVVYRGARALALMGPGRRPQRIYVLQDERWIKPENAGRDIRFDEESESFVWADEPRVYDLVRNPTDDLHEVILVPSLKGSKIFEASFSDRCLAGAL